MLVFTYLPSQNKEVVELWQRACWHHGNRDNSYQLHRQLHGCLWYTVYITAWENGNIDFYIIAKFLHIVVLNSFVSVYENVNLMHYLLSRSTSARQSSTLSVTVLSFYSTYLLEWVCAFQIADFDAFRWRRPLPRGPDRLNTPWFVLSRWSGEGSLL